ncbi:serine hydrolase domain-containing protein [Streptomyces sp. NPDC001941]|uniref:serine hydrolase domain-containing protein n=1 Tax=Streptomyces sp. NPDC001941 TaxID=3154659 RepID=UPI00332DD43C
MRARFLLAAVAAVLGATALTVPAAQAAATPAARSHAATRAAMAAAVADGVPGVAGKAVDRDGTWGVAVGVGNLRTGAPRSADDRFRAGSITKTFVATVLLQLEAEGRLDLDDTVDHWLPGLVRGNGNDDRRITLRRLLNHTSGIFNYTNDADFRARVLGPEFLEHRYETHTPRELVAVALRHPPTSAPGGAWSYSNTNYVLAGMVIEKATGRPYGDEIRRRIIRPLGLRATSVPGLDPLVRGPHSRGYSLLGGATAYDVTTLNPSLAGAAFEVISDADDLNRFYSVLLRGGLLPRAQLAEMKTTVPSGGGGGYGLGLTVQTLPCGVEVWGHGGLIHGSASTAATTADGRHGITYNVNADWGSGEASTKVLAAEFCPAG